MTEEELKGIFANISKEKKQLAEPLIQETVTLIEQINEIKKYPFFKISENGKILKTTQASKLYKDLLNSLNTNIKTLLGFLQKDEEKEQSPLALYLKELKNK